MKVFYWNIRGLANKLSRDTLFNFCKQFNPDIVCISEPMMNPVDFPNSFLRATNMNLGVFNSRDGISKIWLFISSHIPHYDVVSNSEQEITLSFMVSAVLHHISFIYASVQLYRRRKLWDVLGHLSFGNAPWLVIGDFNVILGAHEKTGGRLPDPRSCDDFATMISDCNLFDIPSSGAQFTWARKSGTRYVECRLDRALCNSHWFEE